MEILNQNTKLSPSLHFLLRKSLMTARNTATPKIKLQISGAILGVKAKHILPRPPNPSKKNQQFKNDDGVKELVVKIRQMTIR